MTVPPQGPREQWGTGLPGIPSIWDTAPLAAATRPSSWSAPPPARRDRTAAAPARRWMWVAVGLVTLLAIGSASVGGDQATQVVQSPDVVLGAPPPFPDGPPPAPGAPPAVPVPGGEVLPVPQAFPAPAGGVTARRTDGGEPFGMPLGTTVVLTDDAAGSRIDVRALSAVRDGGRLLVDVEMQTPVSTGMTGVPAFLLRLADGRELGHRGLTDGQDVPPVLGQGLLWRGTLVYDVPPGEAVLVLDDGRTLAGWTVPAG